MKNLFLFLIVFPFLISSMKGQPIIVYNNSLMYVSTDSITGIKRLGKYDGTTSTMYPNPNDGMGYYGDPIIFNGKFYFSYAKDSSHTALACFDGNSVALIPFQENMHYGGAPVVYKNSLLGIMYYDSLYRDSIKGDSLINHGYSGSAVIFNNDLYFSYQDGKTKLAKYDGIVTTVYENPDAGVGIVSKPVIWNNKLYFIYENSIGKKQLATLKVNTVSLISNPDTGNGMNRNLIVFNNEMYTSYVNSNGKNVLAKFNGSGLTLIPNPDSGSIYYELFVNGNNLYSGYFDTTNSFHIAKYDGTSVQKLANPDLGLGYTGTYQLYNGNIYIDYKDINLKIRLAKCDGNVITLINNPDAGKGYQGYSVIYNNKVYFKYTTLAGPSRLGSYDGSSISLVNNTYLGGRYKSKGVTIPEFSGHETGPYTQSLCNIVEYKIADLKNATYYFADIFPNPFSGSVQVSYTLNKAGDVTIELYDITGVLKAAYSLVSQPAGTNFISINTNGLSNGVYTFRISANSRVQSVKGIKK